MSHGMSGKEVGVKIPWPGHLDPHPRFMFLKCYEVELCVQEELKYFLIKLFPNITALFYQSQLHVPLYVRNRGWGSRYRGLGILTPTQFYDFEIKMLLYPKKNSDNFR